MTFTTFPTVAKLFVLTACFAPCIATWTMAQCPNTQSRNEACPGQLGFTCPESIGSGQTCQTFNWKTVHSGRFGCTSKNARDKSCENAEVQGNCYTAGACKIGPMGGPACVANPDGAQTVQATLKTTDDC